MHGYRRRASLEHNGYASDHQLPVATCYDSTGTHDFEYHNPSPYNMIPHPFGSYASQFGPSYYGQQPTVGGHSPGMRLSLGQSSSQHLTNTPESLHCQQQPAGPTRYLDRTRVIPARDIPEGDIEDQESFCEESMQSEPVIPALDGFPDVREFDQLMKSYVNDLSVKKQDKALIHARRARNIRTVLMDPKDTAVESAQFRFWVKKMFKLLPADNQISDGRRYICHEGKPVAIREKLFKILTKAHQQCQHGGRDKTSAQVRQIYSWVPKELISRFVKICPTCQIRRGSSHLTPPNSRRNSPHLENRLLSPPHTTSFSGYRRYSGYAVSERPQGHELSPTYHNVNWGDTSTHIQHPYDMGARPYMSVGVRSVDLAAGTSSDLLIGSTSPSLSQNQYRSGYLPTSGHVRYHGY